MIVAMPYVHIVNLLQMLIVVVSESLPNGFSTVHFTVIVV